MERKNVNAVQPNTDTLRGIKRRIIVLLSFFVIMGVFWSLKLTGITMAGDAFCGYQEHRHGEACTNIVCENTDEGHVHGESCLLKELICAETSGEHVHTEQCYGVITECSIQEHIHTDSCYSNIDADIETEEDRLNSISGVAQEESLEKMLVSVARSQIGYTESTANFEVDLHGTRRGITRYGQWYGNPYGDWSAMFVSFCLHYSGAENLPANAGAESMRLEWMDEGLYRDVSVWEPSEGNVVFLSSESNGDVAGTVAIVSGVSEEGISVIQGNVDDSVVEYMITDASVILGYGIIQRPEPVMMLAATDDGMQEIATTINYGTGIFTNTRSFVIYAQRYGKYYAIDGNGNAVPVEVRDGKVYSDIANPDMLLWTFTQAGSNYVIRNIGTGLVMHPYNEGIITSNSWQTTLLQSGSGVVFRRNTTNYSYAYLDGTSRIWTTTNYNSRTTFYLAYAETCFLHFDGTNGGLMSYGGSSTQSRTVEMGSIITLPSTWKSPEKYSYTLKGWYDVGNSKYYPAGATYEVTGTTLFYADWIASSYDIGKLNSLVTDTVSTNSFITTHVFDYNTLFNVMSMNRDYENGSSASWTLAETENVQYGGGKTLNFVFIDHDPYDRGYFSHPNNLNDENGAQYQNVSYGLYNEKLADLLYNTETEVIGKHYVGTGDHLFQYGHDPDDEEFYGYYYYDSTLNAASYNQTDGRFYVYDYLERTSDAEKQDPPSYSDFLPFNSPYANTNGKATGSYTYNGVHNEYVGTSHISYDSKYNTENNSTNRVITNYLFGMSMEMDFYLPAVPGTQDGDGVWGNQSIVGDDMVFEFSGDDDVWVLIDGKLALDIGGIHGVETGSIDFSTGVVTNNGVVDQEKSAYLKTLQGGSHKLTMYYLERGSSLSNFKLRFNLTTRYAMTLRKEDTLNAHLLNGARFAVYTDSGCSKPAQLWNSREEHESGAASTNEFTVRNGVASMWGLAAGNTYYLVETLGPDSMSNVPSKGIIRMRLNNSGLPDYDVLEDKDGNLTVGYTVHGYKVSEDQQEAYLTITNTDATDSEPTEVTVSKVWQDDVNHDRDSVTAYLHANGTRIQSATLSKENNWTHTWTNLPKTDRDGNPVSYTVREATIPGYVGHIEPVKGNAGSSSGGNTVTTPSEGFADGKTYLLQTQYGYIGSDSAGIRLEKNLSTAENSLDTQWVVTVNSNGTYTFTNKDGKTLFYDNYMYKISSGPGQYKNLNFSGGKLSCYIDHGNWNETQYPKEENMESNVIHNHVFYTTTNSSESFTVTPLQIGVPEPEPDPEPEEPEEPDTELYYEYRITNIPAKDATISLKVNKLWDPGELGGSAIYNDKTIEVVLLENGAEAGLSGTLSLRNGWSYTFESLPKYDSNDKEIAYSVKETNPPDGWHAEYGTVGSVNGSETAYEITVTNVYHMNVILPSTGGIGPYGHIILGLSIMLGSLGWYYGQRRKSERRECREK